MLHGTQPDSRPEIDRLMEQYGSSLLRMATAYLLKEGKGLRASLLTAVPASFMSAVSMTYILMAEEGFRLASAAAYPAGAAFAAVLFIVYLAAAGRKTCGSCEANH